MPYSASQGLDDGVSVIASLDGSTETYRLNLSAGASVSITLPAGIYKIRLRGAAASDVVWLKPGGVGISVGADVADGGNLAGGYALVGPNDVERIAMRGTNTVLAARLITGGSATVSLILDRLT